MKKLSFALAAAAILTLAACGTTQGGGGKQLSGVILQEIDALIPEAGTNRNTKNFPGDVQVLAPTQLKPGQVLLPDVYNAIVGNKNYEIFPKDVYVKLPEGVTFNAAIVEAEDVTDWITNLPAGLIGQVHAVKAGAKEVKIYVSGKPTETKKDAVMVTIPGAFLSSGQSTSLASENNTLIDIADARIEVQASIFTEQESKDWTRSSSTITIGGTVGSVIIPKDLKITLIEAAIAIPVKDGENISAWITNLPTGLSAIAHIPAAGDEASAEETKYAAPKGAAEVTVTISGIPLVAINQPVYIRVPFLRLNRALDLVLTPNEDIRFEVFGVDVETVVVGGAINSEIQPKTFSIVFGGTKLVNGIEKETDLSSWFTNIPPGIKALAAEDMLEGSSTVAIIAIGKPTIKVKDQMKIAIPASVTTSNIVLEIPPSDRAMYDIGLFETKSDTDIELTEGSSNKNWTGDPAWKLNVPQLTSVKDFQATGIIQITSKAVNAVGSDGNYHWTGDGITYALLMAEAKKLNAHAIINIVIDHDDVITETIERRHIEATHVPTPEEAIKISKKLITLEADPAGGTIYAEKIRIIERTYTGTALAIKYSDTYAPVEQSGYMPSYK
jgi:hypothetical protein